jgi:hypothetical protein
MAYLKDISSYACQGCGGKATVELYNRYNALVARYCRKCGTQREKGLSAQEVAENRLV